MITDTSFKKYNIDENNAFVGLVEVNLDLMKDEKFISPFMRSKEATEITKLGNRDYEKLERFIIDSLKNYYDLLMSANESDRDKMLTTYTRLYGMWQDLRNFKISKDLVGIDKTYDLFLYELYVLGYTNKKK